MLRTSLFFFLSFQTDSQVDSSQNKFLTCAQLFLCTTIHLRGIETTCVDSVELKFYTSRHTCFNVIWPPNASQHKFIVSNLYVCMKFMTLCDLCELASRLASPFGQGLTSDTSNGVDVQNGTIRNSHRAYWMPNGAIHLLFHFRKNIKKVELEN